jgi:hypothetical protein
MTARETAELLVQVGRLVQAEGYDGELSPALWMALRYFARANPIGIRGVSSDNPWYRIRNHQGT